MISSADLVAFVPATDLERARAFYGAWFIDPDGNTLSVSQHA